MTITLDREGVLEGGHNTRLGREHWKVGIALDRGGGTGRWA